MKRNEDELLRPLFNNIPMEKAPDDITIRIMDQIMANPEIEPTREFYYNWWWSGIALLSLVSIYLTGVWSFLYRLFLPYIIEIYSILAGFAGSFMDLLPSSIIFLPSSYVLPLILPGILFILLMDMLFGGILKDNSV